MGKLEILKMGERFLNQVQQMWLEDNNGEEPSRIKEKDSP